MFERVGRGVAHDEYIDFEVKDGKILYEGDESEISAGKIRVEFIKSYRDNPKVNAIIVGKGSLSGNSPFFLHFIELNFSFQYQKISIDPHFFRGNPPGAYPQREMGPPLSISSMKC